MKKLLGMAAIGTAYCIAQNNWIQVDHIELEVKDLPPELEGFKIAHLSDMHLPRNASNIKNIIDLVKKQEPNIIVMTGDMIDRPADISASGLSELCIGLSEITTVYAVTGNHEKTSHDLRGWKKVLIENEVRILDNEFEIIKLGKTKVALMGLEDNKTYRTDFLKNPYIMASQYRILLVHRPLLWEEYYPDWDAIQPDLVLNGHEHGGQFRIPLVGGLVSHDQGFFPKYTSGLYMPEGKSPFVISRGLGHSSLPLRLNNRPHLPVIMLIKK